jgi:hypothetical protein
MTTLTDFESHAAAEPERPRDTASTAGPAWPGGITLPVLALAALVCSPAIWQCLVSHTVPMQVMLERYVLVVLGCLLVSEVVRRLLWPPAPPAPTTPTTPAGAAAATSASEVAAPDAPAGDVPQG